MPINSDLREFVERRLNFAVGRFGSRVRSVSVRLSDVNGPRGGVDQHCGIRVNLGIDGLVLVEEQQCDIRAAIGRAAERAGRTLARRLAAGRENRLMAGY